MDDEELQHWEITKTAVSETRIEMNKYFPCKFSIPVSDVSFSGVDWTLMFSEAACRVNTPCLSCISIWTYTTITQKNLFTKFYYQFCVWRKRALLCFFSPELGHPHHLVAPKARFSFGPPKPVQIASLGFLHCFLELDGLRTRWAECLLLLTQTPASCFWMLVSFWIQQRNENLKAVDSFVFNSAPSTDVCAMMQYFTWKVLLLWLQTQRCNAAWLVVWRWPQRMHGTERRCSEL